MHHLFTILELEIFFLEIFLNYWKSFHIMLGIWCPLPQGTSYSGITGGNLTTLTKSGVPAAGSFGQASLIFVPDLFYGDYSVMAFIATKEVPFGAWIRRALFAWMPPNLWTTSSSVALVCSTSGSVFAGKPGIPPWTLVTAGLWGRSFFKILLDSVGAQPCSFWLLKHW